VGDFERFLYDRGWRPQQRPPESPADVQALCTEQEIRDFLAAAKA